MRYRAKNDIVLTDTEGNRALVAIGDKVFVQQAGESWEIYSFFTRKCLGSLTKESFEANFEVEKKLVDERPWEDTRGKRGSYFKRKNFVALLFFLLPLGALAQQIHKSPIRWTVVPVKTDTDMYEIQVTAEIEPGWWIYAPNKPNCCTQPTTVNITKSPEVLQLDSFEIVSFNNGDYDPHCKADRYYSTMVFLAPFKVTSSTLQNILLSISYQPACKYGFHDPQTIAFPISLKSDPIKWPKDPRIGEGISIRSVPTRTGKVLWCIGHPFKKPYWKP